MKLSTRTKLNLINIIVFTICTVIVFISSQNITKINNNTNLLKSNIEQHWREQARYTIKNVIGQLDKDYNNGLVDITDNNSLEQWAIRRFDGIRNGSPSSDGWIAELGSEEFIYNQSLKCIIEGVPIKYFGDEIANNPDSISLENVFNRIRLGVPSTYGEDLEWQTSNGDSRWIEFDYYPLHSGINNQPPVIKGEKNENFKRIVIVVETYSDEIYKKYDLYFKSQEIMLLDTYMIMVGSLLCSIIFLFVIFFKQTK